MHLDKPDPADRTAMHFEDAAVTALITKQRRPHNAGILHLGDGSVVLQPTQLPAGISSMETTCPAGCFNQLPALGGDFANGVNVYGMWFHMHQTGLSASNQHFRGTQLLEDSSFQVDYYDFHFQDTNMFTPFKLLPGDSFNTMCAYDASLAVKDGPVRFGLESSDEMCITFMSYYPEIEPIQFCGAEGQCGGSVTSPISGITDAALSDRMNKWPHASSCATNAPTPAPTVATSTPTTAFTDVLPTVVSTVKFDTLDIAQFADAAFDTQFRADFVAAVAAKADVPASKVEIVSITAGSVNVESVVTFEAAEATKATTFTSVLNTDVAQIFAGDARFANFGNVSATGVQLTSEASSPSPQPNSASALLGSLPSITVVLSVGLVITLNLLPFDGVL